MIVPFNDKKSDERLHELRAKEEEQLAQMLSAKYGVDYADLTSKAINSDALRLVPEAEARAAEIAAFNKVNKQIWVAMRAPERPDSLQVIEHIEKLGYSTRRFMVSTLSLQHAWDRYKDISYATETAAGVLTLSNNAIQDMLGKLKSLADVKTEVLSHAGSKDTHRISRVLEIIMAGALSLGASDVHLEPEEAGVRMRYRLDGVLVETLMFDAPTYVLISSRLKLLAGLKLNVKNAAQDGRFSIVVGGKEIEIRLSVLPAGYAETIVMRVLDPSTIALPMDQLGFDKYLMEIFNHEVAKPNGMILNTGPTGSGKTTTLYAFLRAVHNPGIKIVTIEDPIEYHLPGIVQTQVSKDYSFAQGLRSTLRQDPDVIMVGEIRDGEVATTAVQASLTGHLVFSTLHTNDAPGAITRLIDMGVEPFLVGSAVELVIAQRLVRRLCADCAKTVPVDRAKLLPALETLGMDESFLKDVTSLKEAVGCRKCRGTGYRGRVGVFEIFHPKPLHDLIITRISNRDLTEKAIALGMRPLAKSGWLKVAAGLTTIDELVRNLSSNE